MIGRDNRCLKPDYSKDPEDWDHYDPDSYSNSITKEFYFEYLHTAQTLENKIVMFFLFLLLKF